MRSITTHDPEFTDDDRNYALAWQHRENERCGECGHPLTETTHPDSEDQYTGHAVVCFACQAKEHVVNAVDSREGLKAYATRDDA